jgi:hypothetical protein
MVLRRPRGDGLIPGWAFARRFVKIADMNAACSLTGSWSD